MCIRDSSEDFKLIGPEKIFYNEKPDGFEIAFKNTGNVHLVPYGTITIKNMFGKVIQTLPVDAYFVLPDSTRYREIMWTKDFSIGPVSYTHLRAHETVLDLVCRLLL